MKLFSVLLLVPDFAAHTFGHDTYLAHVQADDVTSAIEEAADRANDALKLTVHQPGDDDGWHVLLACEGHIIDIKGESDPEVMTVSLTNKERDKLLLLLSQHQTDTSSNTSAALAARVQRKLSGDGR